MRGFVLMLAVISRVAVAIRGGGGRGGRGLWDNLGQQKQTQADDKADFWAQLAGKSEAGIASTTERFTNRNSYFASSQRRVSEIDRQDANLMLHALNTKSYADSKQNSGQSRIGGGPLEHYWTNDQAGSQRRSDDRPATALQQSGNEHNKAESRIDEVMRVHRLATDTLDSLQNKPSKSSRRTDYRYQAPKKSNRRSDYGSEPEKSNRKSDFGYDPEKSNRRANSGYESDTLTRRSGYGSGRRSGQTQARNNAMNRRMDAGRLNNNRRQDEVLVDTEEVGNVSVDLESVDMQGKRLAAQVNAVTVLDMIKNLQDEIKEIDSEIERENVKMKTLTDTERRREEDDIQIPKSQAAKESAEETMKELALQKEDTTMQKVIAQMMLIKQIQKKKSESDKLDSALTKLSGRRKIINKALKKQKEVAEQKRRFAQLELKRQKEIMEEKERVVQAILQRQEKEREVKQEQRKQNQKQITEVVKQNKKEKNNIASQVNLLEAHMKLVDQSNDRILARIQEIKLQREREVIATQENILLEQEAAMNALRNLQRQRKRKQKKKLKKSTSSPTLSGINFPKRINVKEAALVNLTPGERKQVMEWLDLERNAAILKKTDQKIANKLRAKAAADDSSTGPISSALKIKNAAQILLGSEDDISDAEIDDILGLQGIDAGLDIDAILEDPSILKLDDDALLFEDYDESDDYDYYDEEYEDEYEEYDDYDDEYEDDYEEKEYIYEYEETVRVVPKPRPKPRPKQYYHDYKRYPSTYDTRNHRPPAPYRAPAPQHRPYRPPAAPLHHAYSSPYTQPYSRPQAPPYQRPQSSGAQFLSDVTGLLQEAEHSAARGVQPHITLTGSLRDALLRDVDDHVQTEVHRLPGGRVSTKVRIGPPQTRLPSNPATSRVPLDPRTPKRPVNFERPLLSSNFESQRSVAFERPQSTNLERPRSSVKTFSDLVNNPSNPSRPTTSRPSFQSRQQHKNMSGGPSFSELMGDLLQGKPLPPGLTGQLEHPGNIRF